MLLGIPLENGRRGQIVPDAPRSQIVALRNQHFGKPHLFGQYRFRQILHDRNGRSVVYIIRPSVVKVKQHDRFVAERAKICVYSPRLRQFKFLPIPVGILYAVMFLRTVCPSGHAQHGNNMEFIPAQQVSRTVKARCQLPQHGVERMRAAEFRTMLSALQIDYLLLISRNRPVGRYEQRDILSVP